MDDFNIEDFAKMLDAALASDNPAVKKALRNLMIIAAIAESERSDDAPHGPFQTLIEKIDSLERSVIDLQINKTKIYDGIYSQPYYPGTTSYPSPGSINTTPWTYTSVTSTSDGISGTVNHGNISYSSTMLDELDIKSLLDEYRLKTADKSLTTKINLD